MVTEDFFLVGDESDRLDGVLFLTTFIVFFLRPYPLQEADLYRMAVSWNCQGLGVGRRLVAAAIDFAAEQGFSTLILRTSHIIQAHLFYQKTGFRIVKYETYWVKKVLPLCVYEMVYSLRPS